ncbi:MAG: twin-arginine translocation signal domain-containing protein [bacterium]
MKRIRPIESYDSGYPAEPERGVDRRNFLKALTAGAAGAASVALLETELSSRPLGGRPVSRYIAHLGFPKPYRFAGCARVIRALRVTTWDYQLSFFLNKQQERAGLLKVLYAVLSRHKCIDLTDASRRRRLQHKLGKALAERYTRRTKRQTPMPTAWLLFRTPQKTCGSPVGPTLEDARP